MNADIVDWFHAFRPKKRGSVTRMTIPVILSSLQCLIELKVKEFPDFFRVSFDNEFFYEKNETPEFYFNLFMKNDKSYHYNMKIDKKGNIFKDYKNDASLVAFADEFVRFFVAFDDYLMENQVIGHESEQN